jgi:hypothetical protein
VTTVLGIADVRREHSETKAVGEDGWGRDAWNGNGHFDAAGMRDSLQKSGGAKTKCQKYLDPAMKSATAIE